MRIALRSPLAVILLAGLALAAACSSDPAPPESDEGTRGGTGGTSADPAGTGGTGGTTPSGSAGTSAAGAAGSSIISQDGYPPPPYGVSEGSTIADITFAGLRNPKSAAYNFSSDKVEQISLHDYYNPKGDTTRPRMLLIAASAGWCGPCRLEAEDSMPNYKFWNPKGAEFLTALFDSNTAGTPAAPADATSWSKTYKLEYPMVLDPQQKLGAYANLQAVPFNLVIDLKTMVIVYAQAAVFDASETSQTFTKYLD